MSKKDDEILNSNEEDNVENENEDTVEFDTFLLENVAGLADLMRVFKENGFEVSTRVFDADDEEGLQNFLNGFVDADDSAIPEDANPLNIFYNTPGSKNN